MSSSYLGFPHISDCVSKCHHISNYILEFANILTTIHVAVIESGHSFSGKLNETCRKNLFAQLLPESPSFGLENKLTNSLCLTLNVTCLSFEVKDICVFYHFAFLLIHRLQQYSERLNFYISITIFELFAYIRYFGDVDALHIWADFVDNKIALTAWSNGMDYSLWKQLATEGRLEMEVDGR